MCGLQHEYIRSRLLTEEDNLTFDRSVEIATGLEDAKKHAHLMQQQTKKEEVHRTTRRHSTFNPRSSKKNATIPARLVTSLRCVEPYHKVSEVYRKTSKGPALCKQGGVITSGRTHYRRI